MHMRWRSWMTPFFTIWAGQAFSLIGSSLVQFALVWWLTLQTGSATVLATAALVGTLPEVLLGPLAGACVDRWNRRLVLVLADGIVAAVSAGLALLAWGGYLAVWHIYVAMVIRSIGGAFHWPAMQASTALMVPKEKLTRVAALNQSMHGALRIISPPLGALLVGALPLHGVMAVDVGTAALAIIPLAFIAIPQPARRGTATTVADLLSDMRAGLMYAWRWPAIMGVIAIGMVINLFFNPSFALLPLLITRHMNGEAMGLGAANSAYGIGVVAGGLMLSIWGGLRKDVHTALLGVAGQGLGLLIVGVSPDGALWVVVAGMFVTGVMNVMTNGPLSGLLQRMVAPEMHGRIFTVVSSGCGAMAPLGLALAGPITDAVGLRPWYIATGIVLAVMAAAGLRMRPLMRIEDDAPHVATPAAEAEPHIAPSIEIP